MILPEKIPIYNQPAYERDFVRSDVFPLFKTPVNIQIQSISRTVVASFMSSIDVVKGSPYGRTNVNMKNPIDAISILMKSYIKGRSHRYNDTATKMILKKVKYEGYQMTIDFRKLSPDKRPPYLFMNSCFIFSLCMSDSKYLANLLFNSITAKSRLI